MSLLDIPSFTSKNFDNVSDFRGYGRAGSQSGPKVGDDEGVFSTIFGVPVGTQFGTALFGSGDSAAGKLGILAVDILTDPTTYLTFGIGGILKLGRAAKFMKGLSTTDKMSELNKMYKFAGAAEQLPELSKAISVAASAGDVKGFTAATKAFKKESVKKGFRFTDVGQDALVDIKKLVNNKDLKSLELAFDYEKKFGSPLQIFKGTTAEMVSQGKRGVFAFNRPFGIGASDPIQISKIVNLNNAPTLKKVVEGAEFLTVKGFEKVGETAGKVLGSSQILNGFNKFSATFALNKEKGTGKLFGEITFLTNKDVENLVGKSVIDKDSYLSGLIADGNKKFRESFVSRVFKPTVDRLENMGQGGKEISGAMQGSRAIGDTNTAQHYVQIANLFGNNTVYNPSLRKELSFIAKQPAEAGKFARLAGNDKDRFGMMLDGLGKFKTVKAAKAAYDDQVRTMVNFLDTGKWLHEEGGKFANFTRPEKGTQSAVRIVRERSDDISIRSEVAGIEVIDEAGITSGFRARKHFFPHMHDFKAGSKEISENIKDAIVQRESEFDTFAQASIKNPQLAKDVDLRVNQIMVDMSEKFQVKRFGSLEFHRQFNIPGWKGDPKAATFNSDDAIGSLKNYFRGSEEKLARIDFFGQNNELLDLSLAKIAGDFPGQPGALDWAKRAVERYNGDHVLNDRGLFDVVQAMNSAQVVNKLAFGLASLTNIGQNVNTAVRTGSVNTIKSFSRELKAAFKGDISKFDQMGVITNAIIKEERIVQNSATKLADTWLDFTGFNRIERFNRRVAAHAAVIHAEDLMIKAGTQTGKKGKELRELKKLGVTPQEVDLFKRSGGFKGMSEAESAAIQQKVARKIVEETQFRTQVQDLPLWNASAGGKFLGLFKTFVLKQHEFIGKQVIKPMMDYVITNGKSGSVKPLVTMVGGGLIAGEIIRDAKALLNNGERPKEVSARVLENAGQAGILGAWETVFGISKFGERGFMNAVGGPNVDTLQSAVTTIAKGDTDKAGKNINEFALRFLGPFGRRQIKEDRKKSRRLRSSRKLQSEFGASDFFSKTGASSFNDIPGF